MIKEDLFDKKSQIEALDVLCVTRSQKSGEYVNKVNSRLLKRAEMARELGTTIGQKRSYKEELTSAPPSKIRTINTTDEMEVKSIYSDLSDDESSIPLTNAFSTEASFVPNQEQDRETIPSIMINEDGDIIANKKIMHNTYLKIRQNLCDLSSQRDWFIENYNVSDAFRKYQINNIDKLDGGETFHFSSDGEAILSLHHIMFIDLTRMRKPSYVDMDERKWRSSIRQPKQPTLASFFGEMMNEYEKEINDIDELRCKFYDMWGEYRDKLIYSDDERRLFETTQIVARTFYEKMHTFPDSGYKNEDTLIHEYVHDTFKETFRDSNYNIIWANNKSLSSRDHRMTYGRSKGKKPDITVCRIIGNDKREEACFVEAKPFSMTRASKTGGYNLYKVAIFCQGSINKISSSENTQNKFLWSTHLW